MLTVGAALVGLGVAAAAIQLVALYGADYIPRIDEIRMSWRVVLWLAVLAIVSGLIIGLVPALHSSRLRMDRALARAGGRRAMRPRRDACGACSSPPNSRSRRRCWSRGRWCCKASIA